MVHIKQDKSQPLGSQARWRVTAYARTKAEAFAKAAKCEEVNPEAFKSLPVPAAVLAHTDGHTATGAGHAHDIAAAMIRDRVLATDDDAGAPGEPPRCKTGGCDE